MILKPVFIIAIVIVAMIGITGIGYMDSANAEIIEGDNISTLKPYCTLPPHDINNTNGKNSINVNFNAYTRHHDLSVVIQMDGKIIFNQFIPDRTPTKISETFEIHEQNSHSLLICLMKNKPGSDYRMMDITNVKWTLGKVTPPKTPTQSTPTQSTPIPDVVKSIDCRLKGNPQFDRYYENNSELKISIVNPHPNNCRYEVEIYDSAKKYQGTVDKKLISSLGITFNEFSEGDYLIVLKSMQNGKSYGYYPLTIVDKTTSIDLTPIDPTIILIIIAVAVIAIIAVAVSKRKTEPREKPKNIHTGEEPDKESHSIDVKKFLTAIGYGDEDEFIQKFKSGKTEQECQKAFKHLLVDLIQQNADAIVTWYVRSLIQGSKQEPTIPKRPDAPRLANASTTTQPLGVIVTWTEPNDGGSKIISYELYRSATGKSKGFHIVERGIRGLTFMDTLPSVGTWYYDVIATNSIGSSPPSLAASITVGGRGSGGQGDEGGRGSGGQGDEGGRRTSYTEEEIQDYKTLKISPGATQTEIKTAHRKLIIKYHPDKAKSDNQRKEFTAITTEINLAKGRLMKK